MTSIQLSSHGGYRSAAVRERCAVCGEVARNGCDRCRICYCDAHILALTDGLCGDCDAEWELYPKEKGIRWSAMTAGATIAGGFVLGGLLALPLAAIGVTLGGVAAIGALGVYRVRTERKERGNFISEGDRHDRLRKLLARHAHQLPAVPARDERPDSTDRAALR